MPAERAISCTYRSSRVSKRLERSSLRLWRRDLPSVVWGKLFLWSNWVAVYLFGKQLRRDEISVGSVDFRSPNYAVVPDEVLAAKPVWQCWNECPGELVTSVVQHALDKPGVYHLPPALGRHHERLSSLVP